MGSSVCLICCDNFVQPRPIVSFETIQNGYVSFHTECLHRWIEAELNIGRLPCADRLYYDLKSCGSTESQLYSIAKDGLEPKLVGRYDELLVVAAVGRGDLLRLCGRCNVLFVGCPKSREDTLTKCPNCGECPYVSDAVTEKRFKKWRTKNRHQRCRDCGRIVQRSSGCVHMVCRCGSYFCYRCGARTDEKHSLSCTTRFVVVDCVNEVSSFMWWVKRNLTSRR